MYTSATILAALLSVASAAQGPWAQCGGINWTGGTTCQAGWSCQYQNPYYSQCLQSTNNPPASKSSGSGAVQGPWDQCGGINWTGGTTCTSGWSCQYQNPYYSQCLQSTNGGGSGGSSAAVSTTTTTTQPAKTTAKPPSSSTPSSTPSSGSGNTGGSGPIYKSSFTFYGAGDSFGSPNCNTNTAACGFFTQPGFSAAASQNLFGVGPGAGAGPACGTCWRLTAQTDSSGNTLSNAGNNIVVMINNLCPGDGNPLCSQNGLSGTNQYGANVNFDLCRDSGASAALFQNSGVGLAVGTAQQVDCSLWSGQVVR